MKILNFLQYNNAVPIAVSVLLLGAGGAFAASDPGAIYSADQQIISIDNSYIISKDLSGYSPQARITAVTEDADNYYVAYDFYTIDLSEGAWRDVLKQEMMTVSKAFLGQYRDLGLYVTDQLKENVDAELARLRNTQEIERKNATQKVVATTYGGLIGQLLDTTTEVLPGYTPVVAPPPETQVAASGQTGSNGTGSTGTAATVAQIGLQVLGNNPAIIQLHASYSDLGAVLIDPLHQNVGIHVFQNGAEVAAATVDTSTTSVAIIEYRATDLSGTTIMVRRVVLVGGAADPGGEITSAGATAITNPQPTIPASSSPPPSAEPSTPVTEPATTTSATTTEESSVESAPTTDATADDTATASSTVMSDTETTLTVTESAEAETITSNESASSTPEN